MTQRRLTGIASAETTIDDYFAAFKKLPGWLRRADFLLFQKINELQKERRLTGDLLEIGVFRGRSAILLGYLASEDEQLVLCDLFRTDFKSQNLPASPRQVFENSYLQFHSDLPKIMQCPSEEIAAHFKPKSFRFIHVDGGHSYDVVRTDVLTSRRLLQEGGVVVFDDYLNRKFPGVAAAVWGAVAEGDLIPICLTEGKLYGSWSPELLALTTKLESWAGEEALKTETISIKGRDVIKLSSSSKDARLRKLQRVVGKSRRVINRGVDLVR